MRESPNEREHWSKIEAAQKRVMDELSRLVQEFGEDSEEDLLVRQAEVEDWDLARRMTLISQLQAKLSARNNALRK